MNFTYQRKHAPTKLAFMAASSMIAVAGANRNPNWLTDTGAFDQITPDLSQLSLLQQPIASEIVTVGNEQELPVTHIGNGKLLLPFHNFSLNNILKSPLNCFQFDFCA